MGGKFQGILFPPLDESKSLPEVNLPALPSPLLTLPRLQICLCEKVAFQKETPATQLARDHQSTVLGKRETECEAFPREVDDGGQAGRYTGCWRHQPEALGSQWGRLKQAAACARTLWHDGRVILFMK